MVHFGLGRLPLSVHPSPVLSLFTDGLLDVCLLASVNRADTATFVGVSTCRCGALFGDHWFVDWRQEGVLGAGHWRIHSLTVTLPIDVLSVMDVTNDLQLVDLSALQSHTIVLPLISGGWLHQHLDLCLVTLFALVHMVFFLSPVPALVLDTFVDNRLCCWLNGHFLLV